VADNTLANGSIANYSSFMYCYIFMDDEMLSVRERFLVAKIIFSLTFHAALQSEAEPCF